MARRSLYFLSFIIFLAIAGPSLSPHSPNETVYENGEIVRSAPPSLEHPFGTTSVGADVLSQILYGSRPTVIMGLLGGGIIISIGATVGITAGFVGGTVDNSLMRFTDFVYGVPLLPFAIVLISVIGIGFYSTVGIIGLILWRGNARVLRSEVLQIKEKPYIQALQASGASTPYIIIKHILPNVGSMVVLFFSLGVGYAILVQSGLAFLGISDPFTPSWGVMIRNAFDAGQVASAWWWSIPPGLMITGTVLSAIMLGRRYESIVGQTDDVLMEMG